MDQSKNNVLRIGHIIAAVFIAVALASAYDEVPNPAPATTAVVADSPRVGKKDTATDQREKEMTPATWTPHQIDSLLKHMNIYTKFIGPFDTTNKYVNRDFVMRILNARAEYRGRDSAFLFIGEGCLQVELRLGTDTTDMDTLLWRDICADDCFDSLRVPLGCYDTVRTEITDTSTQRLCDTVCTQQLQYQQQLLYSAWQSVGMASLVNLSSTGCQKFPTPSSPYYTWIKFVLYGGQWYQLSDTSQYHHFVPAADSCYIRDLDVGYFLFLANGVYGPSIYSGQGPWFVDSTETLTATLPVPCQQYYGLPGVTRTLTNCRDTLMTITRTQLTVTWVSAGADTVIWDNGCDCMRPYFVCATAYDSTRRVKYIYDYTYTRDSVQCEKEYLIPIRDVYPKYPRPAWQVCQGDPELDTTYARLLAIINAHGKRPRSTATQVHVTKDYEPLTGDTCFAWSCITDLDRSSADLSDDYWIERDELNRWFSCPPPTCAADIIGYNVLNNWCCEKDTTLTYICIFEGMAADTLNYLVKIPDRTGACSQWTYTDWVKTDSTLIDSLVWWEITGTRTYYQIAYEDTCCYLPMLNGLPLCPPLWIINDCGPQLYVGDDGYLHIPCPSVDANGDSLYDGTDYKFITDADAYRAKLMADSLATLRHKYDSLQTVYDRETRKEYVQAYAASPIVVSATTAETAYDVTGWTVRILSSAAIQYDSTAGTVTLNVPGVWRITMDGSVESNKVGTIHAYATVDDAEIPWVEFQQSVPNISVVIDGAASGDIVVDAGAVIKIKAVSSVNSTDITFDHFALRIELVDP